MGGIITDLNERYGRGSVLHSDMVLASSMAAAQRREAEMQMIERQLAESRAVHLRRREDPAVNVTREKISADLWYKSLPDSSPIKKFIKNLEKPSVSIQRLSTIANTLLYKSVDGLLELDSVSLQLLDKAHNHENKKNYIYFIKDVLWIDHIAGRGGIDISDIDIDIDV